MQEKYGFIYIWRDRKHRRYYVGSHWGNENDGYVCSSTWMLQAHKKRPQDFKRRILEKFTDRDKINEIEHRWLQMIKPTELKKRYYNFHNHRFGHWSSDERSRMTVGQKISAAPGRAQKISAAQKGRMVPDERKKRISESVRALMTAERRAELSEKCSGWTHGDAAREKISAGLTGRPVSEGTRAKIGESNRGKKRSPGVVAAMRLASTGERNAGYGKKWINDGVRNRRIPPGEILPDGFAFGKIRVPPESNKYSIGIEG